MVSIKCINIKSFKKPAIISGIVLGTVYVLLLALSLLLSLILNSQSEKISQLIEDASGFKVKLEKISIITTPKLTAGLKIKHADFMLPEGESFLQADNFRLKIALLPILARKIRVDIVSAENVDVNLKVRKDGKFLIENYIPSPDPDALPEPAKPLPFGIKLSNHLPDIKVKNYNLAFVDMSNGDKYTISGSKAKISDFIFDKKIKAAADGKITLKGRTQFNYDVKILNKIMPDVDLNELVFPSRPVPAPSKPQQQVNIIDIFQAIYNNSLTTDAVVDLKISGTAVEPDLKGKIELSNISVANTPPGSAKFNLAGDKIDLDAKLYTAPKELTEILGNFRTGRKPHVDLTCKSNAGVEGLISLVRNLAKSCGVDDLDTLSGKGAMDVDFNLKTDLKTIHSAGHFNVSAARIVYGLHNVIVDDINARVSFDSDIININQTGFSIAGAPLKVYGVINSDAVADLNITAQKLLIKGLLAAAGQLRMLRENDFRSGTLSLDIALKGRLDKINPTIKILVDELNVKNIPSDTTLLLANADTSIYTDNKNINGLIKLVQLHIMNPAANIMTPFVQITAEDGTVNINANPLDIDILKERNLILNSDIKMEKDAIKLENTGLFSGSIPLVNVIGSVVDLSRKPVLDIKISMPKEIPASVPGFSQSGMTVKADIAVSGAADKPSIKSNIRMPMISIPEMDFKADNLAINLTDFAGSGTMGKLKSGGIVAQNLSSDFALKSDTLYLTNIKGDAFSGKLNGRVFYGLADGKIGVNMKGVDMDAEKAIAGAAGIKNALSGNLSWDANVNLKGVTQEEMMKSLSGKVSFNIDDGTLGNIGRLENFLGAENIAGNAVMRTALAGITSLPAVSDTAHFKYITGNLNFSDGWVNLAPIKSSGREMAYYIKGKHNLLNGTTNAVVLGRLSAKTVKLLGPIGDLSVDKITSYIPKFGALTGAVLKSMTTKPEYENVDAIPQLSGGNKDYKDFKVDFNGGVDSKSSVKSFKWLSNVDTSVLDQLALPDLKQSARDSKDKIKQLGTGTVSDVKQAAKVQAGAAKAQVQSVKQQADAAKQQFKDLKNIIKN